MHTFMIVRLQTKKCSFFYTDCKEENATLACGVTRPKIKKSKKNYTQWVEAKFDFRVASAAGGVLELRDVIFLFEVARS